MKQVIGNVYIKEYRFSSRIELLTFHDNQKTKRKLWLDKEFGDNFYCYICCHSLTQEKQFIVSFSSDENEENLNIFFWENSFVMDTGKNIYFIDEDLNIENCLEITTPLVGLYLVNKERLLLLEEVYMRVVNQHGQILGSETFGFIENFHIIDSTLILELEEETKVIELT